MRKLSSLVLLLVGVLYPFIVYFGMDHVSTPIFGLILGGLWLVRAPALWHQPGGRWIARCHPGLLRGAGLRG